MHLCQIAGDRWPQIDAAYYNSPVPLLRMKPHRFLNMVYSWCIERVKSDELDAWIEGLHELLPWQDTNSEAAINLESQSFMAAMAKGGG